MDNYQLEAALPMLYEYAVVIGRFQPPHKAHIKLIEQALEIADQVIVIFGSNRSAPNIKNPWTAEEREEMIGSCFSGIEDHGLKKYTINRLHFTSVRDYYYNDNQWITEVQQKVYEITGESRSIVLVGHPKDRTSYYLDLFPQWESFSVDIIKDDIHGNAINSTGIREHIFSEYQDAITPQDTCTAENYWLPKSVLKWIKNWSETSGKERYNKLQDELKFYTNYKSQFITPFPITFVTADVLVIKSGHILLVKRKTNPGKGLLALPGGFLGQDETLIDCAFRELKEETRIKVDKKELKKHLKEHREFDHPDRSLRGRTITHAYYVRLPDGGELPYVKGGDDASHAFWMPFFDITQRESEFFEDHVHIISYFLLRD